MAHRRKRKDRNEERTHWKVFASRPTRSVHVMTTSDSSEGHAPNKNKAMSTWQSVVVEPGFGALRRKTSDKGADPTRTGEKSDEAEECPWCGWMQGPGPGHLHAGMDSMPRLPHHSPLGHGFSDRLHTPPPESSSTALVLGITLPVVFLCTLLALLGLWWYWRRRQKRKKRTPIPDYVGRNNLGYNNNDISNNNNIYSYVENPRGLRASVDLWRLERACVDINYSQKVGSGAFADVYIGFVRGDTAARRNFPRVLAVNRFRDCRVAVKTPPAFADMAATDEFRKEIEFMKSLRYHPQLVTFLGFTDHPDHQLAMCLEFCANGDLLRFVRANKEQLMAPDRAFPLLKNLVSFAWQAANGMVIGYMGGFIDYLHNVGCIHRDVAARNILLDENYSCKIGDFGLCRLTANSLYTARGGRFPVRWMSPEAIQHFQFSFQSDVWAYGVLLYEIFSLGEIPYADLDQSLIADHLRTGARLPRTAHFPAEVYEVAQLCWRADPAARPSFADLAQLLMKVLETANDNYGYIQPDS